MLCRAITLLWASFPQRKSKSLYVKQKRLWGLVTDLCAGELGHHCMVRVMACPLFVTKPSPVPFVAYCMTNQSIGTILVKFYSSKENAFMICKIWAVLFPARVDGKTKDLIWNYTRIVQRSLFDRSSIFRATCITWPQANPLATDRG